MKIKITLALCAFFALSLSAQRQYTASPIGKTLALPQSQMMPESSAVVDTILSFDPNCSLPFLYTVSSGGYVTGTNSYSDMEKAELFTVAGTGTVSEVFVLFGAKEIVGTADNITVKIYSGNAANGPSTLLGTSSAVSVTNVDTSGLPTSFTFSTPVSFTNSFFASVEVDAGNDTLGIYHTDLGCQSTAWEMWSDNSWNNLASAWSQGGAPFDVGLLMAAEVDVVPPSCPQPTGLGATNIATTSADVYWTTGGASGWDVEVGPTGFTLGTGTQVNTLNDTLSLTGLTPGTLYDFYVRDSCGPGDLSAWAGPYTFVTDCGVQSLPYTETFEVGTSSTLFCLTVQQNWTLAQVGGFGNSSFSLTFPFYDVQTGTFSVTFPEFTPTPANYELSFDFAKAAYATESDSLKVYYSTDGGSNFNLLVGLDGGANGTLNTAGSVTSDFSPSGAADWSTYSVTLPAGVNSVRIDAVSDYGNNLFVDNFSVAPGSGAPCTPTALSAANEGCDSAEVSWTSAGTAGVSIVEYGPAGFSRGSGTVVTGQSPMVLSGLTAGTGYDVYVSDTCSGDTSVAAGPLSFSTLDAPDADFTHSLGNATLADLDVSFDASASQGATSYDWDFGDNNNGSGVNPQHTYTANGTYTVILTVTGDCGTDTTSETVVIEGISIEESVLSRSLSAYPNPTNGVVQFEVGTSVKDEMKLDVFAVNGQLVMSKTISVDNPSVDISHLVDGIYNLRVTTQERVEIFRIQKSK